MRVEIKTLKPEEKHSRQGQGIKPYLREGVQVVGMTLLLSHLSFIPYAHAAPSGGTIVGGSGDIQQSGLTTTIYQNTDAMAINWDSFDVNRDEIVNYLQPNSSSIALNRILGSNASEIRGQINANGQIILVNPNGIFFGETASINVGGLIASGLDISPDDFMNGDYIFNEVLGSDGSVINSGLINAATGGNVALIGKQVENEGVISANLGSVTLAAGRQAVMTFDSDGLIGIRVSREVLQDELGLDAAVSNSGEITAQGGRILLTASQSRDIFSNAVNTGDITQATSVVVDEDGTFTLGSGADVANSGTLDASATDAETDAGQVVVLGENVTSSGTIKADAQQGSGGDIELHAVDTTLLTDTSVTSARAQDSGQGGVVKVLGDKVGLFDQSMVDVSGVNGGGQALIGGDYQGNNIAIRNAARTYVGSGAMITADALQNGDGGTIINWGDEYTWFYGTAHARGGSEAGNGGFVEISGKGLSFDGSVDTTAVNGEIGTLLFDPENILIQSVGGASDDELNADVPDTQAEGIILADDGVSGSTFTINEGTIEDLLDNGTDVSLAAKSDITIDALSDGQLGRDSSSTGSITFEADADNIGGGDFIMNDTSDIIRTAGGVTITAAYIEAGNIDTQGSGQDSGAVSLTATSGDLEVGTINTSGTHGTSPPTDYTAGAINLTADSGTILLNGDMTASSSSSDGAADITIRAQSLEFENALDRTGVTDQTITGRNVTLTASSGQLQLHHNLIINALSETVDGGGTASLNGKVSYVGDTDSALTVNAEADTTISEVEVSGNGKLDVLLTADTNASAGGAVLVQGNIATGGGDFAATGKSYSASSYTINTSSVGAIDTVYGSAEITAKDVLPLLELGEMTVGSLTVEAAGDISQSDGTNLEVTGASSFKAGSIDGVSTGNPQSITLDNSVNKFQGEVSLTNSGDGSGSIELNNSYSEATTLGNISVYGDLTVSAAGNIELVSGKSVTGYSSAPDQNTKTLTFNFGVGGEGSAFSLNGGEIYGDPSGDDKVNIVIDSDGNGGRFDFSGTGSSIATRDGTITLTGDAGSNSLTGFDAATTWNVDSANGGTLTTSGQDIAFSSIESVTGGIGNDDFTITSSGSLSGSLNGGDGTNTLNGPDEITSWNITAENVGTMEYFDGDGNEIGSIENGFSNIANINGGSAADTFDIAALVTGTLNGGAGDDLFVTQNANESVTVNIVGGADSDTLVGHSSTSNWEISGEGSGTLLAEYNSVYIDPLTGLVIQTTNEDMELTFSEIENLQGTDAIDNFTIASTDIHLLTSIDGGANTGDTLTGPEVEVSWEIPGVTVVDDVEVETPGYLYETGHADRQYVDEGFSGIEFLYGGTEADTFIFTADSDSGAVAIDAGDGAGVVDTVDYTQLGSVTVQLSNAFGGVDGAERITASSDTEYASTLIGEDGASTWTVDGTNSGVYENGDNVVEFAGFMHLTGGSGDDDFIFTSGGALDGLIDGGSHASGDSLDMSEVDAVDVAFFDADVGVLNETALDVDNIESITGNGTNSTITGEDVTNSWEITGDYSGLYDGGNTGTYSTDFSGFTAINGGAGDDVFLMLGGSTPFNGAINGGEQSSGGEDVVNYASFTREVEVELAAGNFVNIERFIGKDSDSTLIGDDVAQEWVIDGENSGSVGGIAFEGFNRLEGGANNDTFTINAGGSVGDVSGDFNSGIFGGDGDDTLTVTDVSTLDGIVNFDGGGGTNDEVNLLEGESDDYTGEYTAYISTTDIIDPISGATVGTLITPLYEQLSYTDTVNSFSLNYKSVESVNDNAAASSLYVNGQSVSDVIALGDNSFSLGERTQVSFSNKTDLLVRAALDSDIEVDGNVSVVGEVKLSANAVVSGAGSVSADALYLQDVTGDVGAEAVDSYLDVAVNDLYIERVGGTVYLNETDAVNIATLSGLLGNLDLTASGNITDSAPLTSTTEAHLESTGGSVLLDNDNQLTGQLYLTASADVVVNNVSATNLAGVDANTLTVTSPGGVNLSGDIIVANAASFGVGSQDLTIDDTAVDAGGATIINTLSIGSLGVTDAGNVTVVYSGGDLTVDNINASQTVSLNVLQGGITDGNDDGRNISANTLLVNSVGGIGTDSDALETAVSTFNVVNTGSGVINLDNSGAATLSLLSNDSGAVTFENNDSIAIDRVQAGIKGSGYHVDITAYDGDITGVGPTPDNTYESADVAGGAVDYWVPKGNFGEPDRPIVTYAEGDITVFSMISYDPVFIPEEPSSRISDNSLLQFSAFDTLSALTGEQVVELESLDDVDPAIFTSVQNYNYSEVSILMPRDQLYEDQLQSYGMAY